MASSKELLQTSRPLTHRPSPPSSVHSAAAGVVTPRQAHAHAHAHAHARANSHSILTGSLNATHRVTRRKSMTGTTANAAAVVAVLKKDAGDRATAMPIVGASRRNTMSKPGVSRSSLIVGSLPSPPASLPTHKFVMPNGKLDLQDSAIDDLNDMSDGEGTFQKARVRRASDGQPLTKEGRKSNRAELRCTTCGKGYKHSSCLTKHLWEHTPEWSITSKLLISKHQQVQLLEAASVLMTINGKDADTPPDSARDFGSDRDSESPAASGYSDQEHGRSSADTTPPPQLDGMQATNASYRTISKRYSQGSGISRSYQSAPSVGSVAGSVPILNGFGHHRQFSGEQRPPSSGSDVAAAMELLSCSVNSNNGRATVHLPSDAPPVPPVPAQYLDQVTLSGTNLFSTFPSRAPESFTRGTLREFNQHRDAKMDWSGDGDEDDDMHSRARSDEDDDGVFGRMEE